MFEIFSYLLFSVSYTIARYRIKFISYYMIYNINMADGELPAPQPPPVIPPVVLPVPPVQPPAPPAQPAVPPAQPVVPPVQLGPMPQLNWSHLKPEYAGKPDDDMEVHPLRTNDWMDTHAFPEGVKVKRFCLTLVGEARLWYESLRPIALDWNDSQNQF